MLVFMLVRGQFLVETFELINYIFKKNLLEQGLLSLNEKGPEDCREGNNLTC